MEDITDEMAAADGGPPPQTVAAEIASVAGDPPFARGGHTATKVNGAVYVYGGASREQKYCDAVFRFRIASMSWEQVQVEGKRPTARSGHSAVAWGDEGIVVFGGMNMARETFFSDAWLLTVATDSAATCSWSEPAVEGSVPIARNSHTASVIASGPLAGKMIVVGGSGADGPMLSIQVADLSALPSIITWTNVTDHSHSQVAPREMHAAAALGDHVIVFGGRVQSEEQASDELITLSAKDFKLKVISVDPTNVRRCGHSMAAISDSCLLVTGGLDLKGPHACSEHLLVRWASDVIGYQPEQEQEPPTKPPTGDCGASAPFQGSVSELKKELKARGLSEQEIRSCTERSELEALLRASAPAPTVGGGGAKGSAEISSAPKEVCALDISWQRVVTGEGDPAISRFAHSSTPLDDGARVLVFGYASERAGRREGGREGEERVGGREVESDQDDSAQTRFVKIPLSGIRQI